MTKIKIISVFIILTSSVMSSAQKLPDVQQNSIVATAPLKVDGKLTEPGLNFQAFNKNTRLYYVLMNDDKYLYLVMKTEEASNIRKVMMGGITVTFNPSGKKKAKDAYAITFPVVTPPTRGTIQGGPRTFEHRIGQPEMERKPDSAAVAQMRKKQLTSFNEIRVSGLAIPDTLISVYNKYEIKTAINFDDAGNLIYEFSIPIKLLGFDFETPREFSYNIKVNGRPMPDVAFIPQNEEFGTSGGGRTGPTEGAGRRVVLIDGKGLDPSMLEPTDFWGKYTLGKK